MTNCISVSTHESHSFLSVCLYVLFMFFILFFFLLLLFYRYVFFQLCKRKGVDLDENQDSLRSRNILYENYIYSKVKEKQNEITNIVYSI